MTSAQRLSQISEEDYLSGEVHARFKHEYVAGMVYAMAGGTYAHNLIASNVLGELHSQLKGKHCRALNSDSKVRIQTNTQTRFYYPDVSVVCGENALDGMFQDKPTVIVEVLSESTRRTDEGEKLDAYQTISALNVYVMFRQDSAGAVVYRRCGTEFQREVYTDHAAIILLSEIDVQLRFSSVYDEVHFVSESGTPELN